MTANCKTMASNFGAETRQADFSMREGSVLINHGSFGMIPKVVQNARKLLLDECETHPDDFVRRKSFPLWEKSLQLWAPLVNADKEDIVFVQNATTGIDSIIKSIHFKDHESILCNSVTYLAVKNICDSVVKRTRDKEIKCHTMNIMYPIESPEEVANALEVFLQSHPDVKVVVLDHITSVSATVMPIKELIQICRKYGAFSLIDAAHAPGQLEIDLKDLDPDFYTGNLHKWAFAPRGCAFLYVKREHQSWVRPVLTSWGYGCGYNLDFFNQATRDDTPFFCVPAALQYLDSVGGIKAIQKYANQLLDSAVQMLKTSWKTEILMMPKSMEAPYMRLVKLPPLEGYRFIQDDCEQMMADIYESDDIQTAVMSIQGANYLRLSVSIYNTLDDFVAINQVIRRMAKLD